MTWNLAPAILLEVVVAGLLVFLAILLVRARPASPLHWALMLVLLLRGGSSLWRGLVMGAPDHEAALLFSRLTAWYEIALIAATAFLLAHAPGTAPRAFLRHGVTWTGVAVAGLFLGAYVLRPHDFVGAPVFFPDRGIWSLHTGAGLHIAYGVLTLVTTALIVVLARAYASTPSGINRDRAFLLLFGLALYPVYAFGFSVMTLHLQWGRLATDPAFAVHFLTGGVGALVAVGAFAYALRAPADTGAHPRRVASSVLLAALFAVGLVDGLQVWGLWAIPGYANSAAAWRLLSALVLSYGILKYDLFDVEIRAKRAVAAALVFLGLTLAFLGTVLVVAGFAGDDVTALALAQVVGAGAAFLAYAPLKRLGGLASESLFPTVADETGYLLERKLAVYRAALERAVEAGEDVTTGGSAILQTLRGELDITDREHAALSHAVRALGAKSRRDEAFAEGDLVLGRYRVARVLGSGGFARTYLARDEAIGRDVAVKQMLAQRFTDPSKALKEARLLASVNHPNVIALHDVERIGDEIFLVMEYAPGGSVRERLREKGPMDAIEAARILDETLAALDAAHARGILHRDVKPANLLFTIDGRVKLADFGIARDARGREATRDALSILGVQPGTPAYMSPEQARGVRVDATSDLYSAAVLFHECLTGHDYLDFSGLSDFEVRERVLTREPGLDAVTHSGLRAFLRRALAKDSFSRFATAAEMRTALRAALGRDGDDEVVRALSRS